MTINPWINFNGNAEDAFAFYQSVFVGEIGKITRLKDIATADSLAPEADANKIMQISLTISEGQVLFGNDVPSFLGTVNERENRSKIHLRANNKEEAEKLFITLSAGGEVEGEMGTSPWGTSFAMFRDKYGIEWIIES